MVRSERRIKDEVSRETRYFLLSFPSVKTFATAVRGHWGIENSPHWVLDVAVSPAMSHGCVLVMPMKISRCSATSSSISCVRNIRLGSASIPSASKPAGTTPISYVFLMGLFRCDCPNALLSPPKSRNGASSPPMNHGGFRAWISASV